MLFRNIVKFGTKVSNDTQRRNAGHLAFIGVGNMGARMTANLVAKGESVRVFDVDAASARSVPGAAACATPAEAVRGARLVVTMLPTGDVVREAVLGGGGVLESAPPDALILDCSTIEPRTAQELHRAVGKRFLDAPVSGGVTGAAAGTLCFMVGGEKESLDKAEPVLKKMGANVLHCGPPGAGQVAKLCNNLILAITMIGTAEGMNVGIKMGLDPKTLANIINVSTGRSWTSQTYNPVPGIVEKVPPSDDYKGGFAVKLVAKDLGLAEGVALGCNAPVPLTAAAHQIYRTLMVNGFADKDFAAVYPFFKGGQ